MALRPVLPGQLVQVPPTISGVLNLKGSTNCSANPNYPSATKGDMYYVSVAGKIGGASGIVVGVGDSYTASADNAGGTQASVGTSWFVLAHIEPAWGDIVGTLSDQTDLQSALDAKLTTSGSNLTSISTREFKDLQFDLPSTSSITFSDPTKTLLLGASAVPNIASSVASSGAQLVISTRNADTKWPTLITGDFRNGLDGEPYTFAIDQSGQIYSNAYLTLNGGAPGGTHAPGSYMFYSQADVPYSVVSHNGLAGGHVFTGIGQASNLSLAPTVFDMDVGGGAQFLNPFGTTGGVNYQKPQIVLGNIGVTSAPAWTYSSMYESAGTMSIGRYNNSTFVQGSELQITSGAVRINGTLSPTGVTYFGGASFNSFDNSGSIQTYQGDYLLFNGGIGSGFVFNDYANTTNLFKLNNSGVPTFSSPSSWRSALSLVPGTDVQAYDADLTTWAGITPGTGVGTALGVNVGSAGAFLTNGGAGVFTTTTQTGKTTTYNNIATVGNGVPSEVATIDSTGLTANVAASTLYAVPASGAGLYRVSAYLVTTTAASVSSTMPNAQVVYTDNDSNTSVTLDVSPILGAAGLGQSGLLTANTVGTVFSGTVVIYVKASTTIQYQTVNYASTAGGMAYALRMKLEAL